MQLRPSALGNIAKMIYGDSPYIGIFPYRSSSYLTRFFEEIDLPYVHDGSTRFWWVRSVLIELNSKPPQDDPLPSKELVKVIEYLVHPDHYVGNSQSSQSEAIEAINEVLRSHELEIISDTKTGMVSLQTTTGQFISTAIERKKAQKTITFSPTVFSIPDTDLQEKLVAVMMPFAAEYDGVYKNLFERHAFRMDFFVIGQMTFGQIVQLCKIYLTLSSHPE